MMVDLYAEMRAAAFAVRQVHLDRLRALGVSFRAIAEMGAEFYPVGVVDAEPSRSGLYQPGHGSTHLVLPVLQDGALVDLVAFRSTAPDEWSLRVGNGWALGMNKGVGWHTWMPSAHLFSNPLDWLRGGGFGLCVLDWKSPEISRLDVLPAVTVSDPETATLLQSALSRPAHIPHIHIMEAAYVA